jgi:hypothetical protein
MKHGVRFVFTQLSAVVVMIAAMVPPIIAVATLRSVVGDGWAWASLVILLPGSMLAAILVWKWILLLCGILSPREAKGYPYSRPWE